MIYLETWAKEQKEEIDSHTSILAEIKARLDQITASEEYHNCGIKKCCAEHDKGEVRRHDGNNELVKGNKNLIAGSSPKSTPNSKQINEEDKNQIKEYFQSKDISSITLLHGDKLLIVYNDKSQEITEIDNSQLQQIKTMVKNQPNQSLSFSELQDNDTTNSSSQGNSNKLYYGLIIGVISGIVLTALALIFTSRKKSSSKKG